MAIKKEYSQAARVQAILRILGISPGITIGELGEVLGVTKRTIYRDLKALEDSGYPVYTETIEGTTYWKLEESFKNIPPVTFSQNELMALYFSKKLLTSFQTSPLQSDIESAFKKIESALPAKYIAKLERIEDMFLPLGKIERNDDLNQEVFDTIRTTVLNQNPLKIEYTPRKNNKCLTFEVNPYSLVLYQGELYILGYLPEKGTRYFALAGIKKAERSKDQFSIPEDFSPDKFLSASFGLFQGKPISLKVVFDRELSDYIQKRKWHQSQRIQKLKDGKILLALKASGKEEVKAWLLSFGPKAKVLSPLSLKKEIEADLQNALLQYKAP
ncbi:MAG TPA: WYL domain-containing protein [Thermodesulfobacteriota bacterium]|nr:WYL domain-containing protein [Thermodesulfobacteriota bacterium]